MYSIKCRSFFVFWCVSLIPAMTMTALKNPEKQLKEKCLRPELIQCKTKGETKRKQKGDDL